MAVRLYQFLASHFNEKVRWALEYKQVPHERISLLPGPHMLRAKRLSGQTQTPILVDGSKVVAGSAHIIEHLERRFPEPALYPTAAGEREEALRVQSEFDAEVGPAVRLAKFFEVLDADFAIDTFCREASASARAVYRAAFPVIQRVMKAKMKIDAGNAERARERVRAAFDFLAERSTAGDHLVGDRFTVADLACAALMMPAVDVSAWGGPPEGRSTKTDAWFARWADHPGAEWVRGTYRNYRAARS